MTLEFIRVSPDHWNFETARSATPFTPVGANVLTPEHPGASTLFTHFDAAECDWRLGLMAAHGLNCLRQPIGVNEVFDPATGLKATGMRNWETFLALAEKHGVYVMPVGGYVGGHDWFDADKLADNGRALDESCAFWEAFAGHFAGSPAIMAWDLRNELFYTKVQHMVGPQDAHGDRITTLLKADWPTWLERHYGNLATLNRAYGTAYREFREVPGTIEFIEKPFDRCAYDFRCYLNNRGHAWCRRQCEVLRRVAPNHMVCSGNNGWLFPDMDLLLANGFHNHAQHDLYDFISIHPYPAPQCCPGAHGDPLNGGEALRFWLNACIGMARIDHYGKPVMLQEFGWYGGGESAFLCPLPFRTETEHADYLRAVCDALVPHAQGFINWPLHDMPAAGDISNHGGLFTAQGRPKAAARVFQELSARLNGQRRERARGTVTLSYSLLGLFTSRSYQDRLWEEIHQVLSAGEIPDFRFT